MTVKLNENGQIVVLIGFATTNGNSASGVYVTPNGGCTGGDWGTWTGTRTSASTAASRVGVLSQVASGAGWKTSIYLQNVSSSQGALTVNFWSDSGGALALPLTVTQAGETQSWNSSTLAGGIAPHSTVLIESTSSAATGSTGWAEVLSTNPVTGYGVFHYTSPAGVQSEGTVPLEATYQSSFMLPFENLSGFQMGVALANLSLTQSATITATILDENGTNLTGQTFNIGAGAHTSFMLTSQIPAAVANRGMVQFTSTNGTNITGLGLRVNPAGGFTSVPKLANAQ